MSAQLQPGGSSLAVRLLPGAVLVTYLLTTVVLFFFGPWRYPVGDTNPLVWFLTTVHVALAAGYLVGIRRPPALRGPGRVTRLAAITIGCSLVVLLPTSLLNTGELIPNPFAAASDLGGSYLRSLELREDATPWINYGRIVMAPALAAVVPLGVFFWNRFSRLLRVAFVAAVCGNLALGVAMGINAEAAHFALLFPWFVVAAHVSGERRMSLRRWLAAAAVALVGGGLLVTLFATSMNVRVGSFARHGSISSIGARLKSLPPPDANGRVVDARGEWRVAVDGLAGYLSHGYYAVYLSLQEPFVPMYGVGNSVFLQRQAVRLFGTDSLPGRSYPARIEDRGWNAYGYWATVYPWIASDVGFSGTVVVMFLAGLMFGLVWIDVLEARNAWAVAFLGQMLVFMYYVPAHNKVMHSGEGVVAFLTLGALWLGARRARHRGATVGAHPS